MPFVALNARGRLLLPRELRQQLGFTPGSAVYLEARDGYLYVAPIDDPYILMPHDQFLREAAVQEETDPIEKYPALQAEIAAWDKIPDDWLDEFPYAELDVSVDHRVLLHPKPAQDLHRLQLHQLRWRQGIGDRSEHLQSGRAHLLPVGGPCLIALREPIVLDATAVPLSPLRWCLLPQPLR